MKLASLDKPDVTIYVDEGVVTIQHFEGAFSLHLRMTGKEAYDLAQSILSASFIANEEQVAA